MSLRALIDSWRTLRRPPAVTERLMSPTSPPPDNDLLICELQHRVDELLADNDSLQERLWALNIAIVSMAEKISELEEVK